MAVLWKSPFRTLYWTARKARMKALPRRKNHRVFHLVELNSFDPDSEKKL